MHKTPETMKSIVFAEYGGPEVLQLKEGPIPPLTPDGVRVKVVAAGINPADSRIRQGTFRLLLRLNLPFIPGSDVAGIVTDVGANVTGFKPGDAVYTMLPTRHGGAYAEYIVMQADLLTPMPDNLTFGQAAGVPLAALTALQALRDKADLKPGQHVLIYGASGGVGSFAVQIARAMGATVTGVCSTRNIEMVKQIGAQTVIDYTQQSLDDVDAQYDVVLDAVAKLPFRQALRRVRPGGVVVSLNPGLNNPFTKLYARFTGRHLDAVMVKPNRSDLQAITQWIAQRQITPLVDRQFSLEDAAAAHRYSDTQRARGKLVLRIDADLIDTTPESMTSMAV